MPHLLQASLLRLLARKRYDQMRVQQTVPSISIARASTELKIPLPSLPATLLSVKQAIRAVPIHAKARSTKTHPPTTSAPRSTQQAQRSTGHSQARSEAHRLLRIQPSVTASPLQRAGQHQQLRHSNSCSIPSSTTCRLKHKTCNSILSNPMLPRALTTC